MHKKETREFFSSITPRKEYFLPSLYTFKFFRQTIEEKCYYGVMVTFDETKQNERLDDLRKREEENLTQVMSQKYGIPYLDLSGVGINIDALRVQKEDDARAANMAIFNIIDRKLSVGILSPNFPKSTEAVEDLKRRGYVPTLYLVSPQSLKKVWERYKDLSFSFETTGGALDITNEDIVSIVEKVRTMEDIKHMIEEIMHQNKSYRISRTLEIILAGSLSLNASDVHFEPEEKYVRLRYRLDGVLTDVLNLDLDTYALLLSRMKLLSNLKLNVKGRTQDGRFSIKLKDTSIEIRTSLLPGAYSEAIVLRILNPNAISIALETMGMHPRFLAIVQREISKPNGMILTTGPTGSGKTTTLYAFLRTINEPGTKIITIENPIEYHLPGVVQTQTDSEKGYTFSEGLRSSLRQDPDIIMVGEIRDNETAEIAVNAALTGHLVFSTLHTNNAAGTYPRLIDLGINPKVLTSAINISMAQRLVRQLCDNCRKEVVLEGKNKELVDWILESINDKTYLEGVNTTHIFAPVGCTVCNGLGYKGRIGIFEAIVTDENLEKIVQENPSEREIKKATANQNILDMRQDGILKILQGITSLEELIRVVDLKKS